jgi:hypothetical protein
VSFETSRGTSLIISPPRVTSTAVFSLLFSFSFCPSATITISLLSFRFFSRHIYTIHAFHPDCFAPICRTCWGRCLQALCHIFSIAFPCFLLFCTTLFRLKELRQTRNSSLFLQILERAARHRITNTAFFVQMILVTSFGTSLPQIWPTCPFRVLKRQFGQLSEFERCFCTQQKNISASYNCTYAHKTTAFRAKCAMIVLYFD